MAQDDEVLDSQEFYETYGETLAKTPKFGGERTFEDIYDRLAAKHDLAPRPETLPPVQTTEQEIPDELGFMDAMNEAFTNWERFIPVVSSISEVSELADLYEASKAVEADTATQEQYEMVAKYLAHGQADKTFGYLFGSILAQLPAFVGEFMMGGALAKKAGMAFGGKALREAIEASGKKARDRALGKAMVKRGTGKGGRAKTVERGHELLARGRRGVGEWFGELGGAAAGRTAAIEGITGPIGLAKDGYWGGRSGASAFRRAMQKGEMYLSPDEYDRLHIHFNSTIGDFTDSLPAGMADMFIEYLSESMGPEIMRLPMLRMMEAGQMTIAQRFIQKGKYKGLLDKLRKGGWHGPIEEFMEERFGGVVRSMTLKGEEEFIVQYDDGGEMTYNLSSIFPEWKQMAAELTAFTVPGVGAAGLTRVMHGAPTPLGEMAQDLGRSQQEQKNLEDEFRQRAEEKHGEDVVDNYLNGNEEQREEALETLLNDTELQDLGKRAGLPIYLKRSDKVSDAEIAGARAFHTSIDSEAKDEELSILDTEDLSEFQQDILELAGDVANVRLVTGSKGFNENAEAMYDAASDTVFINANRARESSVLDMLSTTYGHEPMHAIDTASQEEIKKISRELSRRLAKLDPKTEEHPQGRLHGQAWDKYFGKINEHAAKAQAKEDGKEWKTLTEEERKTYRDKQKPITEAALKAQAKKQGMTYDELKRLESRAVLSEMHTPLLIFLNRLGGQKVIDDLAKNNPGMIGSIRDYFVKRLNKIVGEGRIKTTQQKKYLRLLKDLQSFGKGTSLSSSAIDDMLVGELHAEPDLSDLEGMDLADLRMKAIKEGRTEEDIKTMNKAKLKRVIADARKKAHGRNTIKIASVFAEALKALAEARKPEKSEEQDETERAEQGVLFPEAEEEAQAEADETAQDRDGIGRRIFRKFQDFRARRKEMDEAAMEEMRATEAFEDLEEAEPARPPREAPPADADLAAMSQDEYADYLVEHGTEGEVTNAYNLLTRRADWRGLTEEEKLRRAEESAAHAKSEANQELQKALERDSDIKEKTSWHGWLFGDSALPDIVDKTYLTLKDAKKLTLEQVTELKRRLNEAGYNGQFKIPASFGRMAQSMDNLVFHGKTKAEAEKALRIAEEVFAGNVGATHAGVDHGKKSHTELLAESVRARRKAAEEGHQEPEAEVRAPERRRVRGRFTTEAEARAAELEADVAAAAPQPATETQQLAEGFTHSELYELAGRHGVNRKPFARRFSQGKLTEQEYKEALAERILNKGYQLEQAERAPVETKPLEDLPASATSGLYAPTLGEWTSWLDTSTPEEVEESVGLPLDPAAMTQAQREAVLRRDREALERLDQQVREFEMLEVEAQQRQAAEEYGMALPELEEGLTEQQQAELDSARRKAEAIRPRVEGVEAEVREAFATREFLRDFEDENAEEAAEREYREALHQEGPLLFQAPDGETLADLAENVEGGLVRILRSKVGEGEEHVKKILELLEETTGDRDRFDALINQALDDLGIKVEAGENLVDAVFRDDEETRRQAERGFGFQREQAQEEFPPLAQDVIASESEAVDIPNGGESLGKLDMTPDHAQQVQAGTKTLTTRGPSYVDRFYKGDGIYDVGGERVRVTKRATVSANDPRINDAYAREEGYASLEDMKRRVPFDHVRNWLEGRRGGQMTIFRLEPVGEQWTPGAVDRKPTRLKKVNPKKLYVLSTEGEILYESEELTGKIGTESYRKELRRMRAAMVALGFIKRGKDGRVDIRALGREAVDSEHWDKPTHLEEIDKLGKDILAALAYVSPGSRAKEEDTGFRQSARERALAKGVTPGQIARFGNTEHRNEFLNRLQKLFERKQSKRKLQDADISDYGLLDEALAWVREDYQKLTTWQTYGHILHGRTGPREDLYIVDGASIPSGFLEGAVLHPKAFEWQDLELGEKRTGPGTQEMFQKPLGEYRRPTFPDAQPGPRQGPPQEERFVSEGTGEERTVLSPKPKYWGKPMGGEGPQQWVATIAQEIERVQGKVEEAEEEVAETRKTFFDSPSVASLYDDMNTPMPSSDAGVGHLLKPFLDSGRLVMKQTTVFRRGGPMGRRKVLHHDAMPGALAAVEAPSEEVRDLANAAAALKDFKRELASLKDLQRLNDLHKGRTLFQAPRSQEEELGPQVNSPAYMKAMEGLQRLIAASPIGRRYQEAINRPYRVSTAVRGKDVPNVVRGPVPDALPLPGMVLNPDEIALLKDIYPEEVARISAAYNDMQIVHAEFEEHQALAARLFQAPAGKPEGYDERKRIKDLDRQIKRANRLWGQAAEAVQDARDHKRRIEDRTVSALMGEDQASRAQFELAADALDQAEKRLRQRRQELNRLQAEAPITPESYDEEGHPVWFQAPASSDFFDNSSYNHEYYLRHPHEMLDARVFEGADERVLSGQEFLDELREKDEPPISYLESWGVLLDQLQMQAEREEVDALNPFSAVRELEAAEFDQVIKTAELIHEHTQVNRLYQAPRSDESIWPADVKHPKPSFAARVARVFLDKFMDIRQWEKRLTALGIKLPPKLQLRLQLGLQRGKVAAAQADFERDMVKPFTDFLIKSGISWHHAGWIAYAFHAEERNESLGEIGSPVANPSGLSKEQAEKILSWARTKYGAENIDALSQHIQGFGAFSRKTWVEAGLMTEGEAKTLADLYPHYVPLHEQELVEGNMIAHLFMSERPEDREIASTYAQYSKNISGIDIKSPEFKKAIGRFGVAAGLREAKEEIEGETTHQTTEEALADLLNDKEPSMAVQEASNVIDRLLGQSNLSLYRAEVARTGQALYELVELLESHDNKEARKFATVRVQPGRNKQVPSHAEVNHELGVDYKDYNDALQAWFDAHPENNRDDYANQRGEVVPTFWTRDDKGMITKEAMSEWQYWSQPNVVVVSIDGVRKAVTFNENQVHIAQALKDENMAPAAKEAFVHAAGSVTRFLASVNTRWDPFFLVANFFRDAGQSYMNLAAQYGFKTANEIVNPKTLLRSLSILREAQKLERDNKYDPEAALQDPRLALYEQYRRSGAKITFLDIGASAGLREHRAEVGRAQNEPHKLFRAEMGAKTLAGALAEANDTVENGSRFALFMYAMENGLTSEATGENMTEEEAAWAAKNLTVNFEQKGTYGSLMNAFYMFSNAGIQSTYRMYQALTTQDEEGKTVMRDNAWKTIGAGVAAGASIAIMNSMLGGVDPDDDEPYWDKVPDWEKKNNMILMDPTGGSGYGVKVPLPYGYNFLYSIGSVVGEVGVGSKTIGDVPGYLFSVVMNAFNPLGGSVTDMMDVITPSAFKPQLELSRNRDWKGSAIYKNRYGDPTIPDSQLAFDSVSDEIRGITSWLNAASGGNEHKAGWVDVNPATIQHIVESSLGGIARTFTRTLKTVRAAAGPEDVQLSQIPGIRRLTLEESPYQAAGVYRERRNEVLVAQRQKDAGIEISDREESLTRLNSLRKSTETAVRKLRAAQRRWPEGHPSRKALEEQEKRRYDIFNRRYRMAMEAVGA